MIFLDIPSSFTKKKPVKKRKPWDKNKGYYDHKKVNIAIGLFYSIVYMNF